MTCATCLHYKAGVFSLAATDPQERWESAPDGHGICRRHPPRFVSDPEANEALSLFPSVHRDQRCGEFLDSRPVIPW